VENMCPHKEVFDTGVPTFFGTDGMPDSMLFGIFCAANAPAECQYLDYEKSIEASCAAVADYEGDNRGRLAEGCKADLVLADKSMFASLAKQPDPVVLGMMKMFELEGKVKRVFKDGVQVVPKPKPPKS